MKQRLPDITANFSLAVVLHIVGLKIITAWRVFTPESLQRLGFRTIEEAHAKRAQGQVQIANESGPKRKEIERIFDQVSSGDYENVIPDLYVKDGDDFRHANEIEIAAMLATMTLKVRAQLNDALSQPGNYILRITGEPTVDESVPHHPVINFPPCRLISANASAETRAKILP